MKKFLRRVRGWLLRPVLQTQEVEQASRKALETELLGIKDQVASLTKESAAIKAMSFEIIRGTASLFLSEVSEFQRRQQYSMVETLERIRDENLSFSRFGDGELRLMLRPKHYLRFQKASPELAAELESVLTATDHSENKLLLGFPNLFKDNHWSRVWLDIWLDLRPLLQASTMFGNAHVSRPVFFEKHGEEGVLLWRSVWEDKDAVVITGKDSRMSLIPELFDNLRSVQRIDSSPQDAFETLPELFQQIKSADLPKDALFLISLGPAGTILASMLARAGMRAIDIGHISDSYDYWFKKAAWPESKPLTQGSPASGS